MSNNIYRKHNHSIKKKIQSRNKKYKNKTKRKSKTKCKRKTKQKNKRNYTRKRIQKGYGFFDYFTKHGREQRLIDECDRKNNICMTTGNCDCTVGFGLEKLSSKLYCNKINVNGQNKCVTPSFAKVGVAADKASFWYKNLIQPFKF